MPVKLKLTNPVLHSWILLRHTADSISKCEEDLFADMDITYQQFIVIMSIKYIPGPVTQTDVAKWLDRNNNSITLIIDRMVKTDLVKRARDLPDRRAVRLVITPKGEKLFKHALTPANRYLCEIMSCLSEKETKVLTGILEKIREKTFEYRKISEKVKTVKPRIEAEIDSLTIKVR
jgi:MarR family transcriptional regulator, organic hydroperoxide resistance regulator